MHINKWNLKSILNKKNKLKINNFFNKKWKIKTNLLDKEIEIDFIVKQEDLFKFLGDLTKFQWKK